LQQFYNQVDRLVALGYPALLGLAEPAFRAALEPLSSHAGQEKFDAAEAIQGKVPFVLVINSPLAPVSATLPLIERRGKAAVERLYPIKPEQFQPIEAVQVLVGSAYLLLDVDRGKDTLNVAPDSALQSINAQGRSPLTIEEGIALLTHYPEFLQPNQCFYLLASRCGDKRVPALWLSEGRPKLGWCWAGNPHTWLGSTFCRKRPGAVYLNKA
jgi:hypothetical protein